MAAIMIGSAQIAYRKAVDNTRQKLYSGAASGSRFMRWLSEFEVRLPRIFLSFGEVFFSLPLLDSYLHASSL